MYVYDETKFNVAFIFIILWIVVLSLVVVSYIVFHCYFYFILLCLYTFVRWLRDVGFINSTNTLHCAIQIFVWELVTCIFTVRTMSNRPWWNFFSKFDLIFLFISFYIQSNTFKVTLKHIFWYGTHAITLNSYVDYLRTCLFCTFFVVLL